MIDDSEKELVDIRALGVSKVLLHVHSWLIQKKEEFFRHSINLTEATIHQKRSGQTLQSFWLLKVFLYYKNDIRRCRNDVYFFR